VAHGRGEWASANAQLRAFFQGLLDEVAVRIDPASASLPSSENCRAPVGAVRQLEALSGQAHVGHYKKLA
jgi:hypothetical protein